MKRLLALLLLFALSFSQSAQIVDINNATQNVTASAAYKVYVDTFGTNPDFGMRLCNVGQKYVAAVYSANVSGTPAYVAVSKNLTTGSTDTLVYTSIGSGPCYYTPVDAFAFSQFRDFTRTPIVFVSAFPGRVHALFSDSADGSSPGFVLLNYSDGWLMGGYTLSALSFSQGTGLVTANIGTITFETDLGSISRSPGDSEWGLNSSTGRSILMALCSDDYGRNCSDARIVNSTADLPALLALGSPTSDQAVYNRYAVVNGLGFPICIGSDLSTGISASPGSITYGQGSNITITITNNGNVGVTTDFNLTLNISGPGGYDVRTSWIITENLNPSASTTRNYTFNATGLSGVYTFTAMADANNTIAECNENNIATTTVTVSPAYYLHVWIDENYTDIFPYWGRPYNITLYINDSNGNYVANACYRIVETNGLNPFVPTQVWNNSGTLRGVKSYSTGIAYGNGTGHVQFTAVPTCNLLYTVYSSEGVDAYVGNYSIVINGYTSSTCSGSPLTFAYNNTLTSDYPLLVGDWTCADPGWVNSKELINKNRYVLQIYDWLYQVYAITKKLVVP
ncbi:MAG: CARDB domain-containing protein [Candidatus Micrarchaeota archaeon]